MNPPTFVSNRIGFVMAITTAVITAMKIRYIVLSVPVLLIALGKQNLDLLADFFFHLFQDFHTHKCHLDVPTIVVFLRLGIVMEMTIVETDLTNLLSIVNLKDEPVSAICSLVIMGTVYREFTFVMVIMIVWITLMKTFDINAVSNVLPM